MAIAGGAVLLVIALGACGEDGAAAVDPGLESGLAASCAPESQGGTTSCKDPMTWTGYAAADCTSRGLQLDQSSVRFTGECGTLKGYSFVSYACCPPTLCKPTTMGGPSSCKDPATWTSYATADCASRGLKLDPSSVYFQVQCSGTAKLFSYVDYACCGPAPPAASPTPVPKS
jgi:hypothetical protein